MILHLFIPGVPKNSNARSQWACYASNRDRQNFRKLAAQIAAVSVEGVPWYPPEMMMIIARHVSPVKRRRDPSGLAERLKGILDGLVDANVIPDDDEDHIEITLGRSRKGPVAGISLTLYEIPR